MTDTPIGIFDSGVGGLTVARAILDQLPHEQLAGLIGMVMGDEVTLVSSADETARDVYRVLTEAGLARPDTAPAPQHRFLATGDADTFARLARRFLGAELFATVTGDPAETVAAAAGDASGSRHLTASAPPAETVATAAASGSGPIAVSAASVGAPP